MLLTHKDHTNLQSLVAHADRLIAFGDRQDAVAIIESLPEETSFKACIFQKRVYSRTDWITITGVSRISPSYGWWILWATLASFLPQMI